MHGSAVTCVTESCDLHPKEGRIPQFATNFMSPKLPVALADFTGQTTGYNRTFHHLMGPMPENRPCLVTDYTSKWPLALPRSLQARDSFRVAEHPGVIPWRLKSKCRVLPLSLIARYTSKWAIGGGLGRAIQHGQESFSTCTAVRLYSGVPVTPSRSELVTRFRKTSGVWKVAKSSPLRTSSLILTGKATEP